MRILLVEDEVNLAEAVVSGLTAEGFTVDHIINGTEGYEAARSGGYDALVLDIMLPGMNGYKICRTLRDEGVGTPILILTAKDGEFDEAEALDTGADDFLRKPFSFVVLVARLNALLRRGGRTRGTVLQVGDLTIDPVGHRVFRGETEVELTPREFDLLEFLMSTAGEAVTKQEILEQVWGQDFEGDPNIVEVYIGYLRRKVDRPFNRSTLETVRGIGYRLNPDGH